MPAKNLIKNLSQKSAVIKKSVGTLETLNWTEAEWRVYEEIKKIERKNRLADEYKQEKSHAEGYAKGLAEGKAEGLKEAKVEMAKKLLAIGIPLETIAQAYFSFCPL